MAEPMDEARRSDGPPTIAAADQPAERVKPRRRFAPQLEETSVKSHRKARPEPAPASDVAEAPSKPRRRFAPQLEETSVRSNHKAAVPPPPPPPPPPKPTKADVEDGQRPRTRFAPQLIETATRSRKRGDSGHGHTDETDFSPGDAVHTVRHARVRGREASFSQEILPDEASEPPQSRFSYANLTRSRRSSVRKPTLECIHSSGSDDDSQLPSLSHSPSAQSEGSELRKHATQAREDCDDRFAGYLLAHAARIAEKQLKEQAMAAYPNEKLYEPVDHFAGDRDSDDAISEQGVGMLSPVQSSSNLAGRRESAAGWDAHEMRQHKEALEQQREARLKNGFARRQPNVNGSAYAAPEEEISELRQMRHAAKPPLLGGSLVFPSCPSPKLTHIDAYQKPRSRRYDKDVTQSRQPSGLWSGAGTPSPVFTRKHTGAEGGDGLWGGHCNAMCPDPYSRAGRLLQSGLLTPAPSTPSHELADPLGGGAHSPDHSLLSPFMSKVSTNNSASGKLHDRSSLLAHKHPHLHQLPATPPSSYSSSLPAIDAALARELSLDAEFPDAFVTQVYNYLSLGYPALARKFDAELAKISKLAVDEIRRDDGRADARGYVGAPERTGSGLRVDGTVAGMGHAMQLEADALQRTPTEELPDACGRWRALRLYVREWGRQRDRMQEHDLKPGFQIVRRGSWLA